MRGTLGVREGYFRVRERYLRVREEHRGYWGRYFDRMKMNAPVASVSVVKCDDGEQSHVIYC